MNSTVRARIINTLLSRELAAGGFSEQADGPFRPDATAWSIIAFTFNREQDQCVERSRQRLLRGQNKDGRFSVTQDHPEVFWPTALAALALQGASEHKEAQRLAIRFLLDTSGAHFPRPADSPLSHDTAIPGWPWVDATHSWVEPTALALLALTVSGHGNHLRARQATRLLLDRQLPGGGWNYGNTRVFGQELRPLPASTGVALQALAGRTENASVATSLSYLQSILPHTRTPFSLGWGLLGLSTWGRRPGNAPELIATSLERQSILGGYPTTHLCLLLLAATAENGLLGLASAREGQNLG